VKRFDFGREAMSYISEVLSRQYSLSRLLAEKDLSAGQIFAFLPENVTAEMAQSFEGGGLHEGGQIYDAPEGQWEEVLHDDSDQALVQHIQEDLRLNPNSVCVFESPIERKSDFAIASKEVRSTPIFFENEVFYYALPSASAEEIYNVIYSARNWEFVGVVSRLNPTLIIDAETIDYEILQLLSSGTHCIIVGAYDGEGYLIWHSQD
jgi:hypothetical protein